MAEAMGYSNDFRIIHISGDLIQYVLPPALAGGLKDD
jgi:hypothetical protein